MIKTALPHLLLGVIAAGLSLSGQSVLPNQASQRISIMSIAYTMANLHEQYAFIQSHTLHYPDNPKSAKLNKIQVSPSIVEPYQSIRLTPINGIRAGPISVTV